MKKVNKAQLRLGIFIPMALIFLTAIVLGLVAPKAFYDAENVIVQYAFDSWGWLFQLCGVVFLAICIWAGFSKIGNIRLGGENAKPSLSKWNWFAISLTAGIATGILFWGIAEPITHFMSPPDMLGLEPGSEAAAMFSMSQSYIHWTFIPYAMYSLAGIAIGYATYNMKKSYHISSTLYPIFGEKTKGWVGTVVDNLCLFAMAGGVAAVLGVATMQIGAGLNYVFGIQATKTVWIAIIAVIVGAYVISSYTGLNKGIKFLADKNSKLFLLMLAFIFIFGPTKFILSLGTQSTGHFLDNFFSQTLYLSPLDGSPWPRWWPIYYWAIWLAYAPLTGMFLAKISKGRTIREFITVNLILPAVFGMFWFMVYGGAALDLQLNGAGIWEAIQSNGLEVSVFEFLKNYPLSTLMSITFIVAIFVSVVTLADSMTSTVSSLSTTAHDDPEAEPPGQVKLFWGFVMSSIAIINLLAGKAGEISGIDATKQIATVAGFPILFLMLLMGYSTIKMLRNHKKNDVSYYPELEKDENTVVKTEKAI
ncbi:BCCT family transporter [Acidaminobacter sp. JC074]|uniref:BCCT family transporter n=1 Tax=Acidaminobacter sp. JC074 TaxID=2530199 RepID=UPI001F0E69A8|nr:BCCT family transporter [Acidaminobacter sp. JC074]MCH4886132.1 BCCT family transporter [Acidaminobacter sp. JC074]